jgi:uncharacterized sulfatase
LVIGRETMQPIYDFVDQHVGQRPFFVWYAPFLPHTPFDAPQRYRDRYEGRGVPEHLLPYYAEIARFDDTVGQLIEYLKRKPLMDRTLVVFASDNGFRPDPRRGQRANGRSKLSVYEDGLRTPILIRWDGHAQPATHHALVHTIDICPTVLSAAGLTEAITTRMHGIDLMPSARGDRSLPQRPVFGAIYPNDAEELGRPSRHVRGRWVREGDWKFVVPGPAANPIGPAFYNLGRDPQEQENLRASPLHVKRIGRLRGLLDEWWAAGDDSRVTKPDLPAVPNGL